MLLNADSVSFEYGYDSAISLNGNRIYTYDTLTLGDNQLLKNIKDVSINKDELVLLTNSITLDSVLTSTLSAATTEEVVISTLIQNFSGGYLYTTGTTPWSAASHVHATTNILSATVWNIVFLQQSYGSVSANQLQIYTNFTDYYGNVSAAYLINSLGLSSSNLNVIYYDPTNSSAYSFYYNLSGNTINLFSADNNGTTNTCLVNWNSAQSQELRYTLLTPTAPNTVTFPLSSMFYLTRVSNTSQNNSLQTYSESSLVKYVTSDDNLSISQSTSSVPFNHLITSPYKVLVYDDNIGYRLPININLLKNYYSPTYVQGVDLSTQLRVYSKIYTGLNQTDGHDKVYLGYNSSTFSKTFPADEDTYFHFPYGTGMVALTSVAQSLVDYGARGDITPQRSDRVLKKLGNYKDYSSWGNSNGTIYPAVTGNIPTTIQNGVYFCSWLSGGPSSTPVWMDRFYNPRKIGSSVTLSSPNLLVASNNNYPDVIWDVPSQLTFEPGVLYKYHRIGDNDNYISVNSLSGLTWYINNWNVNLVNQATGLTAGNITNFTAANSATSVLTRNASYIIGNSYGIIETTDDDFTSGTGTTLSFNAHLDDWSKISGDQIVGNFFNGGIGVYSSNPLFTPYFTVLVNSNPYTNTGAVYTYNTDLKLLDYKPVITLNNGTLSAHNFITRSRYSRCFFVVDSSPNSCYLSLYDSDDLLIQKTPLSSTIPSIASETITNIFYYADLFDPQGINYVIIQTRLSSTSCIYRKCTATGTVVSTLSSNTYNDFTIDFSGNPIFFNSSYVLDGNNIVNVASGCNGVINSAGIVYALSGSNLVFGTDSISLSTAILNIAEAEDINVDQDDNLWITYNFRFIAKVGPQGNVIWTKQINLDDSLVYLQGSRVVNFIAELESIGMKYYCLIIDGKSETIYKVDMDGNIIAKTSVPGLMPGGDSTGFDAQRIFVRPYVPMPGFAIKLLAKDTTLTTPVLNYTTFVVPASGLGTGWHHFVVTYDNTNIVTFYIDGNIIAQSTAPVTPAVLYSVYNFKNDPNISIGTSNFKTNTLNVFVQKPTSYMFNGSIAEVRLYDRALNQADIRALSNYYEYNQFDDLVWNCPTGTRAYIDEVERFFVHRLPGSKSHFYNVRIKNSGIVDPIVQAVVESNLLSAVSVIAPVYTQLYSIDWE